MIEIQHYDDATDLALNAAQYFEQCSIEAIASRGLFHVVLSGGSTPKTMFQMLRCDPFSKRVDWKKTHIFWSDERDVCPEDPESNYRMAHESLLMHVPIPEKNIHRIFSELGAKSAAVHYESKLHNIFNDQFPPL